MIPQKKCTKISIKHTHYAPKTLNKKEINIKQNILHQFNDFYYT